MAKLKNQKSKKILPNHHSGKLTHHKHTSYLSLFFVLLIAATPLAAISVASAQSADPVTDGSSNYAVVSSEAPADAPRITSPASGQLFDSAASISIEGNCPAETVVNVYKNQVLSGSGNCSSGRFSVESDLFIGANSIVARAYNADGKASPDSDPVNVRLIVNGQGTVNDPLNPFGPTFNQLFMTTDLQYSGATSGKEKSIPVQVNGGQAPYAVNISWGDGKTDLISKPQDGVLDATHTYDEAGVFRVVINATDQAGAKTMLQLTTVVSGAKPAAVTDAEATGIASIIGIGWKVLAVTSLIVVSFWLGEKREEYVIRKKLKLA